MSPWSIYGKDAFLIREYSTWGFLTPLRAFHSLPCPVVMSPPPPSSLWLPPCRLSLNLFDAPHLHSETSSKSIHWTFTVCSAMLGAEIRCNSIWTLPWEAILQVEFTKQRFPHYIPGCLRPLGVGRVFWNNALGWGRGCLCTWLGSACALGWGRGGACALSTLLLAQGSRMALNTCTSGLISEQLSSIAAPFVPMWFVGGRCL